MRWTACGDVQSGLSLCWSNIQQPFMIRETLKRVPFANSVDSDKMQHNAAFDQGLHCLYRRKRSSDKRKQYFLKKTITWHPKCVCTMDYSKSTVSHRKEESPLVYKELNNSATILLKQSYICIFLFRWSVCITRYYRTGLGARNDAMQS